MTDDTQNIPLGTSDINRSYSKSSEVPVLNRFFEQNPVGIDGPVALLSRPGLKRWLTLGSGPIRAIYSQPGAFDDALFVVSGSGLYRIDTDETTTLITNSIAGSPFNNVSMVATENYLFLADGPTLWYYTDNSYANGTLTASGAIANNDVVRLGSMYYKFTTGDVNTGSPAGTNANPWLVALGASNSEALSNLEAAIGATGTAGTTYSLTLTANTEATVTNTTSTTLNARALAAGTDGNSVATTETGANMAWGAATLTTGGSTTLQTITMPDLVGAIWVEVLASHVIVIPVQEGDMRGRFYWIEPAEVTIDPLNFATAERAPDPLYHAVTLGDHCWMFGKSTTEPWFATGDGTSPFMRVQGRVFDHGIWEGTPVKLGDSIIVTDRNGQVYQIGDTARRLSTHNIEERIRLGIADDIRWSL